MTDYPCTMLLLLLSGTLCCAHAETICRPIEKTDPKQIDFVLAKNIWAPGAYCLAVDIVSPRIYDVHGEKHASRMALLTIGASNVTIDLGGHALSAQAGRLMGAEVDGDENGKPVSHVSIRNGTIQSRTNRAIVFSAPDGSLLSDYQILYAGSPHLVESQYEKVRALSADSYSPTNHLIDGMTIRANTSGDFPNSGASGLKMPGSGNVIRNSTIEITNGQAAIYLFGPNNIIENNTIVFKGQSPFESAAAIKLHHGDGTIIRNNDIVIENWPGKAPQATISLIESKNVVVEGNRVYGIRKLVRMWDEKSGAFERNNAFRNTSCRQPPSACQW